MHLKVHLFGAFQVFIDGKALALPASAVARSLLAYLFTYRNQPHLRDHLVGIFWSDTPEDQGRRRLSQAIWQVRRVFPSPEILILEEDRVQVNPTWDTWTDAGDFQRLADTPPEGGVDPVGWINSHTGLYRGEFLAGFYDNWALPVREQMRNLYLAAQAQLLTIHKRRGAHGLALPVARSLVREDPWNEENHREVMRLCHLLGQTGEALRQYEQCLHTLAEELGVEPSPETRALATEIGLQQASAEPPLVPTPARANTLPALERPDRLPLVGRKAELEEIVRRLEQAGRGEGGMVIVYGEAGIGKTRLMHELIRNAQWRGIPASWGRCYELTGPPSYQPLVEVLRHNLELLKSGILETLWQTEISRLLPELDTGKALPLLKPEEEQHRMLEAITRAFSALAGAGPLLVILEDAHWMDASSLAAIRYLLPRLPDMAILLVITARSEELIGEQAAAMAALESTRQPFRLELARLDLEASGRLIQHALNLGRPPTRFSSRLHAETEGNPFFLTETLRALAEEGLLFRDEHGAWSTQWDDSTEDYTELPLPGGVVQSIERRLERLPGAMQEPLGLAAVIGRGIPFDLWQQACGLGDKELLAAAGEMCRRGLLHRVDPADPDQASRGMDYLFHHDLVRRVAYDRLAPPLLRAYHRRIADALYHLGADKPEAFAYHYTAGQAWELAARYQREAGDRAAAVYANSDALAHYEQALHALGRSPGPPDPMCIYTIHRARERIHDLLGARQEQTRELEAMEGLAGKMGDNRLRAEAAYRKARQAELMCNFPPAIEYAKWAVELSRSAGDTTTETESHMEWGWALLLQGENAGARERFEASLSLARSNDLTRLEADGLHGLGTVCLVIGEFDEGKAYFQQVLEICRKVDIRARAASTLANLGTIASAQGDHGASKMYNEQALGLCREIGDQRGAGLVIGNLASEFLAESDFSAARMYLEQALEIQLAIQALDNAGISYRDLGLLFHRLGDHPKAGEYYDRAMSVFIETGIRLYQCQTLAFQGLLAHHLGDEQRASQQCSQGLAIAREINDPIALGWLLDIQGHILADRKEYDQAIEAYQEAVTLRKETAGGHHAAESLAGLARIAMQQGDLPLASEHIGRILAFEAPPGFDGALEPMRIYLTCYRVLEACRDPRLEQVLDAAHNLLLEQKGTIQDEALETSFLANVTANREIEEAFQALQVRKHGRQATVQLPRLDAATGRPLHPDEMVQVLWTVEAPGDEAVPGKAERRRRRILRLLREAEDRGGRPTYDRLAAALGVDRRTIERDMRRLRQEHPGLPPPRGKMSE